MGVLPASSGKYKRSSGKRGFDGSRGGSSIERTAGHHRIADAEKDYAAAAETAGNGEEEPGNHCQGKLHHGDKAFSLGAKVKTGNGKLSYKSSNKAVADYNTKTGKITLKGVGVCTITVTASETTAYKQKTTKVTIKVNPKKAKLKTLKPGKKSLKVTWTKDAKATGYEVQCCLKKNFKSGVKKSTVKKAKTTSTTFKKLKKGKKYYVRIRAYKNVKVNGKTTKLTGAWSKVMTSKKVK